MGNCIMKESSMQWGGEDWATSDDRTRNLEESTDFMTQRTNLLGVSSGTKVKIRISKKQLEDLLKNPDVQGLSQQEVLARLTDAGDRFWVHRRSWTPALQSIPE